MHQALIQALAEAAAWPVPEGVFRLVSFRPEEEKLVVMLQSCCCIASCAFTQWSEPGSMAARLQATLDELTRRTARAHAAGAPDDPEPVPSRAARFRFRRRPRRTML